MKAMMGTKLRTNGDGLPIGDIVGWFASEKYDGYRCVWNGKRLFSKSGRVMQAPRWFVNALPPNIKLDGELWAGYGTRPKLAGLTRNPDNPYWKKVKYMVFDIPGHAAFHSRARKLRDIARAWSWRTGVLKPVRHWRVVSARSVQRAMKNIVARGGEGVVLRQPESRYIHGRSSLFLKFKP